MTFSDLLQKGGLARIMAATVATHPVKKSENVAKVATVMVAAPKTPAAKEVRLHLPTFKREHAGRLHLLRVAMRRYFNSYDPNDHYKNMPDITMEKHVDRLLLEYDFDFEKIISLFYTLEPPKEMSDPRCKCGYMPPFCACSIRGNHIEFKENDSDNRDKCDSFN